VEPAALTVQRCLRSIQLLHGWGQHDTALRLARQALDRAELGADDEAALHYQCALCLDALGRRAQAALHYARAIDQVLPPLPVVALPASPARRRGDAAAAVRIHA
jgi:tetratricopeptide (TPR) repeat protein